MSVASIPTDETILDYFEREAPAMVNLLERFVRLEAPTLDVDALGLCAAEVTSWFEEVGVVCRELSSAHGPHLLGELSVPESTAPPLVLVGHLDTVWPKGETERRPPATRDGRLYGPGVYDMRAGVLLMVYFFRFLRQSGFQPQRTIRVFLAADEEIGSTSAHDFMRPLLCSEKDTVALVLEPPLADGSLKTERKGVGLYKLIAKGREAHAGVEPERGVNAVVEIMRHALDIHRWADDLEGLQINIGEIHGGTATNVIPGAAHIGIDVRFDHMSDGEAVDQRLRSLTPNHPEAQLHLEGGIIFPPLIPDDRSKELATRTIDIAQRMGVDVGRGRSGGGSDASFLAAEGITVLDGLGVDGGGAHAVDEHIELKRLPLRAAILTRLLLELAS